VIAQRFNVFGCCINSSMCGGLTLVPLSPDITPLRSALLLYVFVPPGSLLTYVGASGRSLRAGARPCLE
jgi:hypothetical protein